MSDSLDQGRSCVQNMAWPEAYAQLSAADGESPLKPEDLERLATAAYLSGRDCRTASIRSRRRARAQE